MCDPTINVLIESYQSIPACYVIDINPNLQQEKRKTLLVYLYQLRICKVVPLIPLDILLAAHLKQWLTV